MTANDHQHGSAEMNPTSSHTPLVSVVTVCLNGASHIGAALDSVLNQTYSEVEHVVIDGGSTDGTLAILHEYEGRFGGRMRWISEPDNGLYDAMNKGIAMAKGELIGTLNADDFYELDAIERVVAVAKKNQLAGVVYGDLRTIDAHGVSKVLETPGAVSAAQMRTAMTLHHPATFVATRVYVALGDYDSHYRIAADYDFLLRAIEAEADFVHVQGVLTNFSLEGVSNRAVREADRENTRVRIAHGVSPASAWARFYKRAIASGLYGALEHSPRFLAAYRRYKGDR